MLDRELFKKIEEDEEKVIYRPKKGTDISYMFFDQVFNDIIGMAEDDELPPKVVITAENMKKDEISKMLRDYLKDLSNKIDSCEAGKERGLTHAIYTATGSVCGAAGSFGLSKLIDYLNEVIAKLLNLPLPLAEIPSSLLPVSIPMQLVGLGIAFTAFGAYAGLLRADHSYDERIEEMSKKLEVGDYISIE
jgi:hypothetical protein